MVQDRLKEAARRAEAERVTVEFQGERRHLLVISMPVQLLYYNPETHRIRAQRGLDAARNRKLEEDPWSDDAQEYLGLLLKWLPSDPDKVDPDFELLRDDLKASGQSDPGVITVRGILVNGNTRCAALRELGAAEMRVGVLPESAVWSDISSVELSLQLRKVHERPYSYINRLIAIDDEMRKGRAPDDIARDFRSRKKTLESDMWIYGLINEAIARSKDGDSELRLIDFEDHQEKLRELHRAYTTANTPDEAESIKESRLAMILLGYAKTDVRFAQADFHSKYLDPKLPSNLKPPTAAVKPKAIPGLPGVSVKSGTAETQATRALTDTLLKARAAQATGNSETATKASDVLTSAKKAIDGALEPAGKAIRLQKRKLAAPERLSDASDDIELCVADLVSARASGAVDEDAFEEALLRLRSALEKLAKEAVRTFTDPGDGVAWLVQAVRNDVDEQPDN